MNIVWKPAPATNFTTGRQGKAIELIVVHWIVGDLVAADSVFLKPGNQLSAHYAVGEDTIHQYVKEENTAYHAGVWDINLRSIGIEHRGGPNLPISEATYTTSAELLAQLSQRHTIPLDRDHVKGHKEFKATQCPGTLDIDRLINEAKQRLQPNHQAELDTLRLERDRNWNLYQEEKSKVTDLVRRINEVQPKLLAAQHRARRLEEFYNAIGDLHDRYQR